MRIVWIPFDQDSDQASWSWWDFSAMSENGDGLGVLERWRWSSSAYFQAAVWGSRAPGGVRWGELQLSVLSLHGLASPGRDHQ